MGCKSYHMPTWCKVPHFIPSNAAIPLLVFLFFVFCFLLFGVTADKLPIRIMESSMRHPALFIQSNLIGAEHDFLRNDSQLIPVTEYIRRKSNLHPAMEYSLKPMQDLNNSCDFITLVLHRELLALSNARGHSHLPRFAMEIIQSDSV